MTTRASQDLRNQTAEVLRQVADGTPVTITVNGKPVAEIVLDDQSSHPGRRQPACYPSP
jgi:antitoxin (DNA-binding transcriptional repressor) of toxin-antitoxin stability system